MTRTLTRTFLWLTAGLVAAFMLLPVLIVVPLSFSEKASFEFPPSGWSTRWYERFFSNSAWSTSLTNSLLIGVVVSVVSVIIGTAAALGLRRLSTRYSALLRLTFLAPLIIPGVVIAVGVYTLFLRSHLVGTYLGFVLAHTLMAFPFVVISVSASLASFDDRLLDASASLGASPITSFALITLPAIAPGVAAGALIAFVTSFDEVLLSMFIQDPSLRTLPVQMYSTLIRDTDPTIAAASTLILAVTTIGVTLVLTYAARKAKDAN
ncbi:ABC transporter permease [Mycolicibacterium sp. YH-1]|uniref:ABC transporter permease n=1 Tax=Mycolicibacterium sp. YH-1 TaxID=2908837 RepID=UPI001F4C18D2|nr:ABC transporter permease [Mycolicibacterium sp. YH-1]UNB52631.1 ABC transporter permease [Mycolicibacterium sp. YH-1]